MNGESDVKGKGRLGSTLLNVIQYTGVGQSTVCVITVSSKMSSGGETGRGHVVTN